MRQAVRLCCPMDRLVHRFRLGMALRFSLLHVIGDARPGVEPTGQAPTSQVVVWRRMIAGPGRTRHPFVFGPLHCLPVGFFLARLKPFHRVRSIGFQGNLDFCAHPVVLGSCARSFGCLPILSVLFHFALSPGTGRGRVRSHRLKGMLPVRLKSVRQRTLRNLRSLQSLGAYQQVHETLPAAARAVAGNRGQCLSRVAEGRFVSSGNCRTGVSSMRNSRSRQHATGLGPESRCARDGSR
jgi:hypothetical protein